MAREIKFRAWDTDANEMLDLDGMVVFCDGALNIPAHLIPMQYTGLKDPNGVGIYEGDIVIGDRAGTLDEVVFDSGCFLLKNAMMHYEATYWGDEIIVKGNIYENPELLSK